MAQYCECGRKIIIFTRLRGWSGPRDTDHDLCLQCFAKLKDSNQKLLTCEPVDTPKPLP